MRIAFFHELHDGGARNVAYEMGKRLKKQHNVDLYVSGAHLTYDERSAFHKAYTFPFDEKKWKGKNWHIKLYKDTIELFLLFLHNRRIAKVINSRAYDVVFIHPSKFTQAPFLLQFIKEPKIYYCEEPLRIVYDRVLNNPSSVKGYRKTYELLVRHIRKAIDLANIGKAYAVWCNSNFSRKNIKKAYGINAKVVNLGVDHHFFKPYTTIKTIDVLYIGSKEDIDGYSLMKEVAKKLPNVKFHEQLSGEKWITNKELRSLYRKSKIVLAFHKNEPFGLIPLEAAACGVPVVALNGGGYRETVINNVTGHLVEGNKLEIANHISSLLKNRAKQRSMEIKARENILENWTWDKKVKLLNDELKKLSYEKRN